MAFYPSGVAVVSSHTQHRWSTPLLATVHDTTHRSSDLPVISARSARGFEATVCLLLGETNLTVSPSGKRTKYGWQRQTRTEKPLQHKNCHRYASPCQATPSSSAVQAHAYRFRSSRVIPISPLPRSLCFSLSDGLLLVLGVCLYTLLRPQHTSERHSIIRLEAHFLRQQIK